MTLPNIITIGRLFLVPVVIWLLVDGRFASAFWVFLIAGISDGVDGILARKFNSQSELGAHLDPIADKALLVSIFLTLGLLKVIPAFIVIAAVSRDILIVGGVVLSWMLDKPVTMKPLLISKANTMFQILYAATVMALLGFDVRLGELPVMLGYLVVGLTILSAVSYLVEWIGHMAPLDQAGTEAEGKDRDDNHGSRN
ncbi:CDP-diacylglycerol--glycerol-3-phosphate 3-phosphatidyltransferase [Cohaesibacter sp. ES.047]|uniref:CDP-alcohol phosphatidyltransferase family protein n=1 Tax=Cohaesibacter sp. ES.047 TaxID=1798205 RepID=UPI000BB79372|nr:CDP-alcohol phosphatidyltransferase family protein [Cohaesibacter sp. ES.047]SNY93810.1 CDP-diacylglycerol--glycerol-3-phosphate 3-phosphatidyltransferase [Cohaesibacter sp. ES.047]